MPDSQDEHILSGLAEAHRVPVGVEHVLPRDPMPVGAGSDHRLVHYSQLTLRGVVFQPSMGLGLSVDLGGRAVSAAEIGTLTPVGQWARPSALQQDAPPGGRSAVMGWVAQPPLRGAAGRSLGRLLGIPAAPLRRASQPELAHFRAKATESSVSAFTP